MRVQYKITRDDIVEANRTLNGGILPIMQVVGCVMMVLGVVDMVLALRHHQSITNQLVPVIAGAYFAFGWTAMVRNAYKRDRRLHQDFQAEITETGIDAASGTATTKYTWEAFRRWSETPHLFLLFQGPKMYNPFPKRAFSAAEAEEFRLLLTRYVPQSKPVSAAKWLMFAVVVLAAILLGIIIYRMR